MLRRLLRKAQIIVPSLEGLLNIDESESEMAFDNSANVHALRIFDKDSRRMEVNRGSIECWLQQVESGSAAESGFDEVESRHIIEYLSPMNFPIALDVSHSGLLVGPSEGDIDETAVIPSEHGHGEIMLRPLDLILPDVKESIDSIYFLVPFLQKTFDQGIVDQISTATTSHILTCNSHGSYYYYQWIMEQYPQIDSSFAKSLAHLSSVRSSRIQAMQERQRRLRDREHDTVGNTNEIEHWEQSSISSSSSEFPNTENIGEFVVPNPCGQAEPSDFQGHRCSICLKWMLGEHGIEQRK